MLKPPSYENIINNIKEKCPNLKDKNFVPRFDTFIQMWGSTCLGFDIDENGEAMFGGQVMTEAYTTVAELSPTLFIVCFNEDPCYAVENPTKEFYDDVKNRCMTSRSKANKRY